MTPEEQRIAIAEACGWDRFCTHQVGSRVVHYGHPPESTLKYERPIPDYPNDLNAMHEAEKTLPRLKCNDYNRYLADSVTERPNTELQSLRWTWDATAPQRAEAFLHAIGKWVEP